MSTVETYREVRARLGALSVAELLYQLQIVVDEMDDIDKYVVRLGE